MNLSRLLTVIIAPLTSTMRSNFPTRIYVNFDDREVQIALDQLRAIDRSRIIKILGKMNEPIHGKVLEILQEMFC